jgi:hypothetical protein
MTGRDVFDRALQLLNYTTPTGDMSGRQNAELLKRSLPVINSILGDILHITGQPFEQIAHVNDPLPVSDDTAMRVMPYGVAMLIAQSENDGDNQQMMASMYNQLRSSVQKKTDRVMDVLPRVF